MNGSSCPVPSRAQQAYEVGSKATDSTRQLEAAALFKAARMMDNCRQQWGTAEGLNRLNEALRHNLRLWTLFQAELARPDHQLPVDLRVRLLKLCAFIDRRTFELMARPEPEKIQILININRHVASGLSTTPQDQATSGGDTDRPSPEATA
jgi:flagellar protein FlaF